MAIDSCNHQYKKTVELINKAKGGGCEDVCFDRSIWTQKPMDGSCVRDTRLEECSGICIEFSGGAKCEADKREAEKCDVTACKKKDYCDGTTYVGHSCIRNECTSKSYPKSVTCGQPAPSSSSGSLV